ncbi:MAG: FkbM family methyltransferase [Clostridia bacterium]|nr:FkbM family methyltransferase [Clostridia bacterium]
MDKIKIEVNGTKAIFRANTNQEEQYFIARGGESNYFQNFVKNIRQTDTILDCGGFHGLFTIFGGLKAKRGKVIVVEPDRYSQEIIFDNIGLNHLKNVYILSCAISKKNTKVSLANNEEHGWSPRLSVLVDTLPSDRKFNNITSVQGYKFSELISSQKIAQVDILKVDIEGAESFIFNKKWKTLVFNKIFSPRIIFLEIHPLYISQFGSSQKVIEEIISSSGYECIFSEKKANEINKIFRLI